MPATVHPETTPRPTRRWLPRSQRVRRALAAGLAALTLSTGGVAAWALDEYVIDHVAVTNASQQASSITGTTLDTSNAVSTATSWSADGTSVNLKTVTTGSGSSTVTYYVADVALSDATVLRSAFADDAYGENIVDETSDIAAQNGAIFAINGDYYGFRDTGIVIRNGVVYRDEGTRQGLAFYADGSVQVYDETTTSAAQLLEDGVWNTLSFGPAIVEGGQVVDGIEDIEIDTNIGNHSIQGDQPRTAVGVIDENHLVFVVVDGRSPGYSAGVTLTELAQIFRDLGAQTAYNLDGGGSSTMYFLGDVVNQPSNGGERATSDILYIAGASS